MPVSGISIKKNFTSSSELKYRFIVTKPLQLLITMHIIELNGFHYHECQFIFVDSFSKAEEIFKNFVKVTNAHKTSILVSSKKNAFKYLYKGSSSDVYLDSDVGFVNFVNLFLLFLINNSKKIVVYEEGEGTYTKSSYGFFKTFIFNLCGIGSYFGGCTFVDYVYLYNKKQYLSLFRSNEPKVQLIDGNLKSFIDKNFTKLVGIFSLSSDIQIGDHCSIYLTGWNVDERFIKKLNEDSSQVFVKFHPHIRKLALYDNVDILDGAVPAELYLHLFSVRCKSVIVYHHNSSCVRYFTSPNVKFLEI